MTEAPANLNDFMSQAQAFIKKAKADGIDDNRIANTVKFMYTLTQQNIANTENTKGTIDYNADTGSYYNTRPGGSADVSTWQDPNASTDIDASDFGTTPESVNNAPTFDFEGAANKFGGESGPVMSQEPTPAPQTGVNIPNNGVQEWAVPDFLQNSYKSNFFKEK